MEPIATPLAASNPAVSTVLPPTATHPTTTAATPTAAAPMIDLDKLDDLARRLSSLVPPAMRGHASEELREELQRRVAELHYQRYPNNA